MEAHGHSLNSYKIKPSTSVRKLRIDLFDKSIKEIIEAKSSARREKVRQALGQVLDYSHIFNMVYPEWEPRQAILLPSKPSEDLVKLLLLYKVSCIYKNSQQLFTRINVDESEIEAHLRV